MSPTVELLRELIRNACINDGSPASGYEHRSVATLIDYMGMPGEIVEPAPGRQSLVYRVPGSNPSAPSLTLLCHLDVVPVDDNGWSVDPFAGDLKKGFVWGRGAVDMLNLAASMATIVRPYLAGERGLDGDLVFVAAADEENGGKFGAQALVDSHWDLVGADYVLSEVAYPRIKTRSGSAFPVVVGEKGPYWTALTAKGTPGHGSAPYRSDNALGTMAHVVDRLFDSAMPVAITEVWRRFVHGLELDSDLEVALLDPDRLDDAIDRIFTDDPAFARYAHAATHMTVSPNLMEAGSKVNIIADQVRAEIDIRVLPEQNRADVDLHLRKAMGEAADRIEITPILEHRPSISGRDNALWDAIVDSLEQHAGSRNALPMLMTGFTDARFWRDRGAVAYGVGLFDETIDFGDFGAMFHGNDERVSVVSVDLTTEMLGSVVAKFEQRPR